MKKIISLILTVAMLLSMTTFVAPVSAETEVNDLYMAEPTREEFLNAPAVEYLDIPFTNDAFATVEELFHYFPTDNAHTIFPNKLPDGTAITNSWNVSSYTSSTKNIAGKVFLIDTILGNAEGSYTGDYLKSDMTVVKNKKYTFKVNGVSNFKLQSTETDGTMNFLYNINNVNFKMGPIGGTGAHRSTPGALNAHKLPNETVTYNTKGTIENPTSVNILMTSWTVNVTGKNSAYAGFYPVKIAYEDGTEETKYVLSVDLDVSRDDHVARTGGANNNEGDADRLAKTIIYVPKTADVSTAVNIRKASLLSENPDKEAANVYSYLSESNCEEIIGKKITLADVKFPNDALVIKGEEALFGDFNIARSPNAGGANPRRYCPLGYVDFFQIPVSKKVTSVSMARDIAAAINWKDENGNTVAISADNTAYIPVTIEGASDDYYYFAKMGRLTNNEQAVFAVTVAGGSLQDEIDSIETRINALDATYNSAQKIEIAEIKNAIKALESRGVLASDFDAELMAKLDALYASAEEEIRAAQIASVEGKITGMAFKYSSEMREEVEGIKAEYDALLDSGILSSEFNQDLINKFSKVYDVYVMASGLEDKVESWGTEYLYSMYADVLAAKELAEGLKENSSADPEKVVSADTKTKIEKFAAIAIEAAAIDTAIDGLDIIYNSEDLEKIIAIKANIDEFKKAGGTEKGLANAELFNALYEAAEADILQTDINNVVAKIEALSDYYSSAMDAEIAEIDTAIASIESRGGVIPSNAASKLTSIKAQRDEAPLYTTFALPYNKDVVESLPRYQDQFRGPDGKYVKNESGHFENQYPADKQWTFAAFITGNSTCDESTLASKLGIDLSTNKATIYGVPYQFGQIKSAVDGVIDEEKNVIASSLSTNVTIDVPNNAYSKIHAAMWAVADQNKIAITYKYADGTSSTEANVTMIAGGRGTVSSIVKAPYYQVLNNDGKSSISYYREYVAQYDTGAPGGGYSLALVDHILTPDDNKILDKIEITFASTDANLFAMTGQLAHSALLNKVLTESVENIDATAEANVRAVLEGCSNIMGSLETKEVEYNEELKATVEENKNIFVAIESITSYTDLDNLTYTVKFTGPVDESSITKSLFAIKETVKNSEGKEESVAFNDYTIVPVVENDEIREVKLVIANNYEYNRKFTLTVDKTVKGVSGKTILTESVAEYTAKPAIDTEFELEENGTGSVKIVNNMTVPQEVTAIVAVYNKNNQMVAKYLVNKTLATGESATQAVSFQLSEGQTVECLVLDSLTNCRKIYNTFIAE